MTDHALIKQALEALEWNYNTDLDNIHACEQWAKILKKNIAALRERLAQPEQEPFCYHDGRNIVGKEYAHHCDVFPLYTEPQLAQQPMTDEENRNQY